MDITVHKRDIINMIKGRGTYDFTPHYGTIKGYEHLLIVCGDPGWKFDTDKLNEMSEEDLYKMYIKNR